MAGRKVSLDDKIKKQEELVFKAKEKYDSEVEKQNRLLTKRRELESKELVKAFEKSKRSLQEVLDFMNEDPEEDE